MPRACPVEHSRSPLLPTLNLRNWMPRACPVEHSRSMLGLPLLHVFAYLRVCEVSVRSHISTVHPETVHTRLHHLIQHNLLSRIHQRRCNRCRRNSRMTL